MMTNEEYLGTNGVQEETRQRCLEAMHKYGENHWWEAQVDDRTYAYYQLKEPVYLDSSKPMPDRLVCGLTALLVRFVHPFELGSNNKESLLAEVERAWRWGVCCTSTTEQAERINAGTLRTLDVLVEPPVLIDLRDLEDRRQ